VEDKDLQKYIDELLLTFGPASQASPALVDMIRRSHESHLKLRKNLADLLDALDHLRLCMKYQAFDLEATRRENAELKRRLEELEQK
jgi:ubiquinone biosynthesis protein UbiJ